MRKYIEHLSWKTKRLGSNILQVAIAIASIAFCFGISAFFFWVKVKLAVLLFGGF